MSTVFVPKGRKSLYTRVTIPLALRPYFKGKLEAWKSLKTTDREKARCLSAEWGAQGKQLFLTLRQQGAEATTGRPRSGQPEGSSCGFPVAVCCEVRKALFELPEESRRVGVNRSG